MKRMVENSDVSRINGDLSRVLCSIVGETRLRHLLRNDLRASGDDGACPTPTNGSRIRPPRIGVCEQYTQMYTGGRLERSSPTHFVCSQWLQDSLWSVSIAMTTGKGAPQTIESLGGRHYPSTCKHTWCRCWDYCGGQCWVLPGRGP